MSNSKAKYMSDYMVKRYHRRRLNWIDTLGGVCVTCGSTDQLEFDHIIATDKEYDVAKILSTGSEAKVTSEMKKCQLLCKDCHLIKTLKEEDIYTVDHGQGITGKKNCRCDLCRPLKNEYAKRYKPKAKNPRGKNPPEHGERRSYIKGCRCNLCKQAQRDYMREYSLKKRV